MNMDMEYFVKRKKPADMYPPTWANEPIADMVELPLLYLDSFRNIFSQKTLREDIILEDRPIKKVDKYIVNKIII